ncbi:MAG: YraN family protein [Gammaproteobacteria bacterium]
MSSPTARTGATCESQAQAYLEQQGLTPLARNYRCKIGEIDLIMRDGETTVFVEVRHRRSRHYGGARASITHAKMRRVARTAQVFMKHQKMPFETPIRFDVVTIDGALNQQPTTSWLKAAFEFE